MVYPADYHMHTALCRHATGHPSDYAAAAVRLGLSEIGFSDHSPMPQDDFDNWRMRLADLDTYVALVRQAQQQYPQLKIRLGLELDYLPSQEAWMRELAERYPWDYLIGSVHYVTDSWVVDNPAETAKWKEHDPADVWRAYAERLTQAAATGLFDIIGHADLPKKFGHFPPHGYLRLFEPFFAEIKKRGTAIELNTGGLRKDCREIYPGEDFLKMAFTHGVPITFGSDAHAPEEVGSNLAEAVTLARRVGYTQYCQFDQRQRTMAII